MEIGPTQLVHCAFGLGVLLGLVWVAAYGLGWVWAWTWAWIDDRKTPSQNPLIEFAMAKMGWEKAHNRSIFIYRKGSDGCSDGACGFFYPLVAIAVAPASITLMILLYPLTLSIFLACLLARLARFARRHKKLFDKHIKDPDAHK